MSIEEQYYAVYTLRKPLQNAGEIIPSRHGLLFAREDTRGVNDGDAIQNFVGQLGAVQPIQKRIPEHTEGVKLLERVYDEGIARDDLVVVTMHYGNETIGCGLGTDANSGKILL